MARLRFAVLGDPVEHSRSPEIHGVMLDMVGLDGEYLRIRADAGVLRKAVQGLRAGEWDGLNVTMPLKGEAAKVADSLSPLAARSMSVNTLTRTESGIIGHSTDSTAFREITASGRFDDATSILVLGAGGSACAALSALADGASVYVAARRPSQAEQLTDRLGGDAISWGTAVAGALVINTTPLGMADEVLPGEVLDVAHGLIDLPYATRPTPAVVAAERRSVPFADGHEFLVRQAVASFTLWTGVPVAFETLIDRLRKV